MRVIILTKSVLHGGFCVAGIDIDQNRWVRLSPGTNGEPMTQGIMTYPDGMSCDVLDVVRVDTVKPAPYNHHTENLVITPGTITRLGHTSIRGVITGFYPGDDRQYIFFNTSNALSIEEMSGAKLDHSLMLVHATQLMITYEVTASGKTKALAEFQYNGKTYRHIRITDPVYVFADRTQKYIPEAYIAMSIARDPFEINGKHYKFAAGIFSID